MGDNQRALLGVAENWEFVKSNEDLPVLSQPLGLCI